MPRIYLKTVRTCFRCLYTKGSCIFVLGDWKKEKRNSASEISRGAGRHMYTHRSGHKYNHRLMVISESERVRTMFPARGKEITMEADLNNEKKNMVKIRGKKTPFNNYHQNKKS